MKQLNLLNWRNTKDKKFFNFFKKAMLVSFFIYIFLVLVLILPLHFYKKKLTLLENEREFLLISKNLEMNEFLNLMAERAYDLDLLLKLQNSQKITLAFFDIIEKITKTNANFKVLRLNRLKDNLFVEAIAESEEDIQKWIKLLQGYKIFKNVRLVDIDVLQVYSLKNQAQLLKFKFEIQLNQALLDFNLVEAFGNYD